MHTYFNKANYVFLTIHQVGQEVIVHSFDPNTQDTGRWISKAKASLVYRASSRTARESCQDSQSPTVTSSSLLNNKLKASPDSFWLAPQ